MIIISMKQAETLIKMGVFDSLDDVFESEYYVVDKLPEADPFFRTMKLCPICGNKRCPKATDLKLECTNSNEPGQKGSAYE